MKAFRKSGAYAGLVLIIAVFLLPFYIMFYLSLSGPADSIAQEWFPGQCCSKTSPTPGARPIWDGR